MTGSLESSRFPNILFCFVSGMRLAKRFRSRISAGTRNARGSRLGRHASPAGVMRPAAIKRRARSLFGSVQWLLAFRGVRRWAKCVAFEPAPKVSPGLRFYRFRDLGHTQLWRDLTISPAIGARSGVSGPHRSRGADGRFCRRSGTPDRRWGRTVGALRCSLECQRPRTL